MLAPASPPPSVRRAIVTTMRHEAIARGLRCLWPPLMVLAGAGALALLTKDLPPALVSALAGLTLTLAGWLFYRAFIGFTPIDELEAKHRIERQAGLSELAPLSSSADRLVGGDGALWSWHRRRLELMASALSKPAKPQITRQDGARLVALMLAVGVCIWQPVSASRALNFDVSPVVGDRDLVLEAWAQPPDYTGLPIVRLDRSVSTISLPQGSMIFARMDGARGAPRLHVGPRSVKMIRERGQAWTAKAVLQKSGTISIDRFGSRAKWQVTAIKDQEPRLISQEPIKIDPRGRLDVSFSATDDYAIAQTFLRVTPRQASTGMVGRPNFETPLLLSGEADEDGARQVFVDVSDHVLTGMEVDIILVVRDGLGQEATSKPTHLTLPTLQWKSALGAALQEQRLSILREYRPYRQSPPAFATLFDGQSGLPIRLDLNEPLTGAPQGVAKAFALLDATLNSLKNTGVSEVGLMAMQYARERLAIARTIDDAHAVAPILWQMAMQAEVSDQSSAQQKVAAARQALEQALKNGATQEELSQLTQELREAVGERVDELAQQSGTGESDSQGAGGNSVSGKDLDEKLRELEQSGSSGARQDALDQLEKLGDLMENMQAGGPSRDGESGSSGGAGPLDEAMREQRDLSDETNARNEQNQGAPAPDLADKQNNLADRLSSPEAGAPPQGPEAQAQASKSQAAQAMREAAEALRRGDLTGAGEAQARAEQALQQAAQAQSANGGGNVGDQDPLGRALPKADEGRGTKVPDQVEKRRARDVREELRRRQADPNRDDQERNYLDRLLKDR